MMLSPRSLRWPAAAILLVLLAGCSLPRIDIGTGTGALTVDLSGSVQRFTSGVREMQKTFDAGVADVKERAGDVKTGFQKVQEGKDLIKKGLKP